MAFTYPNELSCHPSISHCGVREKDEAVESDKTRFLVNILLS